MATVTFSRSTGTLNLTFDDLIAAASAQALAFTLGNSVLAGTLVDTPYAGSIPSVGGGTKLALFVSSGGAVSAPTATFGANGETDVPLVVIADGAAATVTSANLNGQAQTVLAGSGGLTYNATGAPAGSRTVYAGGGNNNIQVSLVPATVFTGSGNDTIGVGPGPDLVAAGLGSNLVQIASFAQASVLVTGQDTIVPGTATVDVFVTGQGSATIAGSDAYVTFVNGSKASLVAGGTGNGVIHAFAGDGGGVFIGGTGSGARYGTANLIVGGAGAATMAGGQDGDVLFAGGAQTNVLSAGVGNETLAGAGATGNNYYFAGNTGTTNGRTVAATTLIGAGVGNDTIFAGTGAATVFGGGGSDLFVFVNGRAGGSDFLADFSAAQGDRVQLQGYAAGAVQSALGTAVVANGGTTITLPDATRVFFAGIGNLSASNFA